MNFYSTKDYLYIITAAIITDLIVIGRLIFGKIKSTTLKTWYHKYNISGVLADVLSIVIGVILARFIYPFIFTKYYLLLFIGLAVLIQICHDLLFTYFFQHVPRGRSQILDTFKDYANQMGPIILVADALMIISTILISTFLSTLSLNTNIIVLIVSLYIVPYFLYSIR
jgi:hypothetical protein